MKIQDHGGRRNTPQQSVGQQLNVGHDERALRADLRRAEGLRRSTLEASVEGSPVNKCAISLRLVRDARARPSFERGRTPGVRGKPQRCAHVERSRPTLPAGGTRAALPDRRDGGRPTALPRGRGASHQRLQCGGHGATGVLLRRMRRGGGRLGGARLCEHRERGEHRGRSRQRGAA